MNYYKVMPQGNELEYNGKFLSVVKGVCLGCKLPDPKLNEVGIDLESTKKPVADFSYTRSCGATIISPEFWKILTRFGAMNSINFHLTMAGTIFDGYTLFWPKFDTVIYDSTWTAPLACKECGQMQAVSWNGGRMYSIAGSLIGDGVWGIHGFLSFVVSDGVRKEATRLRLKGIDYIKLDIVDHLPSKQKRTVQKL